MGRLASGISNVLIFEMSRRHDNLTFSEFVRLFGTHWGDYIMTEKQQNPDDRPSVPRFKNRKSESRKTGIRAAIDAVSALSDEDAGPDDYKHYQLEAGAEKGDRGAAILLATNVENTLQISIRRWLQLSGELRKEVFRGPGSPARNFSGKIIIAHALGIFGPITRKNLDVIRIIRNAFAHASRPIRFDDAPLADLCNFLQIPKIIRFGDFDGILNPEDDPSSPARYRYSVVCEHTSHNLMVHNFTGPLGIANDDLKIKLPYENYEAYAREKPLP
jgi:hypothetical protein